MLPSLHCSVLLQSGSLIFHRRSQRTLEASGCYRVSYLRTFLRIPVVTVHSVRFSYRYNWYYEVNDSRVALTCIQFIYAATNYRYKP
jgi:hypothetical protein